MKAIYKIPVLAVLLCIMLPVQANGSASSVSWRDNPHMALFKTYVAIGHEFSSLFSSINSNDFDSFYDFERYYRQMGDISDLIYEALDMIDATEDMFDELDKLTNECDVQLRSEDQRAIEIVKSEVSRMEYFLDKTSDNLSEASARAFTAYKHENKNYARKATNEIIDYLNRCRSSHFDIYDRLRLTSVDNAFNSNISNYIIEQQSNCNEEL